MPTNWQVRGWFAWEAGGGTSTRLALSNSLVFIFWHRLLKQFQFDKRDVAIADSPLTGQHSLTGHMHMQ